MDPLSDVFSLLKVKSVLSARFEAAGPWALRFPEYRHVKFGGVLEGSRWLWIEGLTEPMRLEAGDFYLLTNGLPYCFASDPNAEIADGLTVMAEHLCADGVVRYGQGDERTVGAGGRFLFDADTSDLLLNVLPPLIHIRGNSPQAQTLRPALELIRFETNATRAGASAVAESLANIVLVNIIRAYLASDGRLLGWLGALSDTHIGPALAMMHGEVARHWKVEDLALSVGMSRTSFSERFRALVGRPPLEYLIRWRLTLARNALKTGNENLVVIATRVGYASETAFSLAFKKMFGRSPGSYRMHFQQASTSAEA